MNEDGAHLAPYLATVVENDTLNVDYAFSMFWYEAGSTDQIINPLNPSVIYIAAVPVRSTTIVGVEGEINKVNNFELSQNYPNPFNPSTSIKFTLPSRELVSLKVYDILGNEVASLLNETMNAGLNTVKFDASNLASGMYFYTIKAGNFTDTKKMMLLK